MTKNQNNLNAGFTLIEIMVSVSIFAVIMLIASGSIYTVFDANRKSQSLRGVMDNLNFSLEAMTRTIRFGNTYHCDVTVGILSSTRNCVGGASSIAVVGPSGSQVIYQLCGNGRIARSLDCTSGPFITSPEINITRTTFYVTGTDNYSNGDLLQPKVVVVVSGYAGQKPTSQTTFSLQTTISQRLFDSQ